VTFFALFKLFLKRKLHFCTLKAIENIIKSFGGTVFALCNYRKFFNALLGSISSTFACGFFEKTE
jgi:hypothetical protein